MTTQSQPPATKSAQADAGAHTPTPWQVYHLPKGYATGDGQLEIQGGEEMMTLVAFIPTERDAPRGMKQRKANAAFIVRACNEYADDKAKIKALVDALTKLSKADAIKMPSAKDANELLREIAEIARAALESAKG